MNSGGRVALTELFLNQTSLDDQRILSGQFWGELRVFLAVAKAGSFSRAARLIGASQPTVSREVKRLQDLMGAQLLVPSQSGVKLTARGERLARSLASLDQSLFFLAEGLKTESRNEQGVVRISVTDGLGGHFLAPALRAFSAMHPLIQLAIQGPANLDDLRQSHTDILIGFGEADASDIAIEQLGTLHLIPIVSSEYVSRHGLPTRRTLANHYFLQSSLYASRNPPWERWSNVVDAGRVAHYCDNSFVYAKMVKAGLGIGLLGNYALVEPSALTPELDVHISLRMYVAVVSKRLSSRPVRATHEWICKIMSRDEPWFADALSTMPRSRIDDSRTDVMPAPLETAAQGGDEGALC